MLLWFYRFTSFRDYKSPRRANVWQSSKSCSTGVHLTDCARRGTRQFTANCDDRFFALVHWRKYQTLCYRAANRIGQRTVSSAAAARWRHDGLSSQRQWCAVSSCGRRRKSNKSGIESTTACAFVFGRQSSVVVGLLWASVKQFATHTTSGFQSLIRKDGYWMRRHRWFQTKLRNSTAHNGRFTVLVSGGFPYLTLTPAQPSCRSRSFASYMVISLYTDCTLHFLFVKSRMYWYIIG